MNKLNIREAKVSDLQRCNEIESTSFLASEAASKESILNRINTYAKGFIVLENEKEIIGFINAGATDNVELSDEEFKQLIGHDENGKSIVVMSVVVHKDYQHLGYAGILINAFIDKMKLMNKKDIYLICKEELILMYEKFCFINIGKSDSTHGGAAWYEMLLDLKVKK